MIAANAYARDWDSARDPTVMRRLAKISEAAHLSLAANADLNSHDAVLANSSASWSAKAMSCELLNARPAGSKVPRAAVWSSRVWAVSRRS
jgi:hypothetical protein